MLVAELAFGRSIAGGGEVGDADWLRFVQEAVVPRFPDGATVGDAEGYWQAVPGRAAATERSKLLLLAIPDEEGAGPRLAAVAAEYERRFRQRSVLVLTRSECVSFEEAPRP